MPKKKNKSIRQTKKKLKGPIKRVRREASLRKKKNVRSQSRTAGMVAAESTEVDVMRGVSGVGETETSMEDALENDFPPECGWSE